MRWVGSSCASLAHFHGLIFSDLERGDDPPDLVCKGPGGSRLNIEVVEIVDEKLRLLKQMRDSYHSRISQEHWGALELFKGCAVTLVDSGEPPYLPNVDSVKGATCLAELVAGLTTFGEDIGSLKPKSVRRYELAIGSHKRCVTVLCERFVPAGDGVQVGFRWDGAGPGHQIDIPRQLLPNVIRQKIQHNSPLRDPFWLLAYSCDTNFGEDDADINESRRLLRVRKTPFNEIWYLYPLSNIKLGHIIPIWPENRLRGCPPALNAI